MDASALNSLYKPIPLVFNAFAYHHNSFMSVAGSDINLDSQVYLLYEMPTTLLARRFNDNSNNEKFKIMVHELNGCIVGPGLYQEWANYIYAARNKKEQNLELCRSLTNNMLFYRATKPIKKGEQLLAWYSSNVEIELTKSLLNREFICPSGQMISDDSQCKRCMINFEYPNILKSHLLFDLCGKSAYPTNYIELNKLESESTKKASLIYKSTSTTPPSSASSTSSSSSSCSSYSSTNLNIRGSKILQTNSAFSPILAKKLILNKDSNENLPKLEIISSRSSSSSPLSITFSPVSKAKTSLSNNNNKNFSFSENNESKIENDIRNKSSEFSMIEKIDSKSNNFKLDYNLKRNYESIYANNSSPISSNFNEFGSKIDSKSEFRAYNSKKSKLSLEADSLGMNSMTSGVQINNKNDTISSLADRNVGNNGIDWKITMLDGTQTVELNMADEMGKQKKTHVCLFCGKIYNRKYGLKIHLRTHTGYKPLKCKVCSRPFSDPSNLNKHVRLHSQGDTPYRCPYCGKILVRKRDLDRHIMSRHAGKEPCNENEMFVNQDHNDDSDSNNDDLNENDLHHLRQSSESSNEITIQKLIDS